MRTIATLTVAAWLLAGGPLLASPPTFEGYVGDLAGVLDEPTKTELTTLLRDLETQTSVKIVVATLASTEGRPLPEYASEMFQQLGGVEKDSGKRMLVVVFPKGRWTRIEVGQALEGILPNALAEETVRVYFEPQFAYEDYAGGLRTGVNRLAAIVRANHVLTPEELSRVNGTYHPPEGWLFVPFFALFLAIAALACGLGLRVQHLGLIVVGTVVGVTIGTFAWSTIPVRTQTILAPWTAVMVVMGFVVGGRRAVRKWARGEAPARGWIMDAPGGDGSGPSGWGPD